MPRLTNELVPLATIRPPDIMDGPHTYELQDDYMTYMCRHCGEERENCRTCGVLYSPYGDGYDGECPECADKSAIESGEIEDDDNGAA